MRAGWSGRSASPRSSSPAASRSCWESSPSASPVSRRSAGTGSPSSRSRASSSTPTGWCASWATMAGGPVGPGHRRADPEPGRRGGPTQEIYDAILRIRNQGKPVVASMGSVAASGGYYLAAAATRIVANPRHAHRVDRRHHAVGRDRGTPQEGRRPATRSSSPGGSRTARRSPGPMTPEERAVLQAVLDDMHDQFMTAIAEGRRLGKERVRALADGRVYSGRMAKQLGPRRRPREDWTRRSALAGELGGCRASPTSCAPRRIWRFSTWPTWQEARPPSRGSDLVGGRVRRCRPCPSSGRRSCPSTSSTEPARRCPATSAWNLAA